MVKYLIYFLGCDQVILYLNASVVVVLDFKIIDCKLKETLAVSKVFGDLA